MDDQVLDQEKGQQQHPPNAQSTDRQDVGPGGGGGGGYPPQQQVYYNYYDPSAPCSYPPQPGGGQHPFVVVGPPGAPHPPLAPPVIVAAQPQPSVSFVGPIVLSCFVYWFCGWMCGGIAFVLAMVGQSSAAAGDRNSAIQMRNASYGLSIAGIITGIIIIGIVAALWTNRRSAAATCYYNSKSYNYYSC